MALMGATIAGSAAVVAVVIGQYISLTGGSRVVPENTRLLPHFPNRWYTG
jgi:hypothetical protein